MVQTGAPDFQAYEQWTDLPLFNGNIAGAAIPVTIGTFNVSQWAYLQVFFGAVNGRLQLTFVFTADAAGLIPTGRRNINADTFSGFQNEISVPCLGRFVTILCTTNGALNPAGTITVSGSNRAGPTVAGVPGYLLLEQFGVGIGAGATINATFNTLFTGPCHISFVGTALPMSVTLFFTDVGGTAHAFYGLTLITANVVITQSPIYIPPAPCLAQIANASAAPQTFSCLIMPDAFRIGA